MPKIETNFTLEPIFTITIDLEPNNKGMLIIQRTLVTETQYNRLIRSFKLGTDKHQGEINYGETEFNGFRMTATVSSENLIPQYVEQFFEMVYDLISVGLKKNKNSIPKPRTDLLESLNHLKVFTDKGISTAFLKHYDIPNNSMIELDNVDTKTLLGSIVAINKNNVNTDFGNSTFDEEDEDEDKKGKINY
jgi:hypothetical protein